MRKVWILLFAASLFVACNNKKDDRRASDRDRERDDYCSRDEDKEDDRKSTDYKDDKESTDTRNNSGDSWSSSEQDQFMEECTPSAERKTNSAERAKEYCACMLKKLEGMYSSKSEAERKLAGITAEEVTELAKDCNE